MNYSALYPMCVSDSNVNLILKRVQQQISLSASSLNKCVVVIGIIMDRNIAKLVRLPNDENGLIKLTETLNDWCVEEIIHTVLLHTNHHPENKLATHENNSIPHPSNPYDSLLQAGAPAPPSTVKNNTLPKTIKRNH